MKGIILSGGRGTRLYPLTLSISKQLLPVYNKPMVYYPLSMLMLAGIRDILIITTPEDSELFYHLLFDGSQFGINIQYEIQSKPRGLADAFIIGEQFIGNDSVAMILGDNVFYGHGLSEYMKIAASYKKGATIFAYAVSNPERYGIVELDKNHMAIGIEEKPKNPKSNYAIPGMYFYDNRAVQFAKSLKPSKRGEIEIVDLNKKYLDLNELRVQVLGRGIAWLDAGIPESLLQASNFIQAIEDRQNLMAGCPEEVAYSMGYIDDEKLKQLIQPIIDTEYGQKLKKLIK